MGSHNKPYIIQESTNINSPTDISKTEKEFDLNLLIHYLKTGYGGRKYVPPSQLSAALEKLEQLKVKSNSNTNDLCNNINLALDEIKDMHLGAKSNNLNCKNPKKNLNSSELNVGQNINKSKTIPWYKEIKIYKNKKIYLLAINSFPSSESKAWLDYENYLDEIQTKSDALIVDIRNNSGGDDTPAMWLAHRMYGQLPSSNMDSVIKSTTPETMSLFVNSIQIRINKFKAEAQPIEEFWFKRLSQAKENYENSLNKKDEEVVKIKSKEFDAKKSYKAPVYILTNKKCASSCESLVELFENYPFAKTIGDNTGGYIHFGNLGILQLKYSKINIEMPTDFWKYKDNRFVEKIGYSPKIRLKDGQDAYAEALKLIKKSL